jgi:benzoyl-CoA reductase subunit C
MFERFAEIYEQRHQYARDWKARTGGKVLGYFCTYVPEEILYAADVLPVRILGSHEPQDVTEPHIFGMFCPFCRDCLAQGLKNRFEYLDGLMIAQSCLHIRQAYTSWDKHRPTEFSYYLNMPHKVDSPRAKTFLAGELVGFKHAVDKWTGTTITDEKLHDGIAIMNRNRELMHQLYALRKADPPPMSGAEALQSVLAMQMSDKREHSALVERLLPALPDRPSPEGASGARLLLVGSEDDDLDFVRMIEKAGGTIVTDEHCTGTRYFWNSVKVNGESPLQAIANRYCDRPPCPTKDWEERSRIGHILALARDWGCRGAIVVQQKFCDPHELDTPSIKKALEAAGIPVLFLELDVTVPLGQFRIRVEAFLEMIQADELF